MTRHVTPAKAGVQFGERLYLLTGRLDSGLGRNDRFFCCCRLICLNQSLDAGAEACRAQSLQLD